MDLNDDGRNEVLLVSKEEWAFKAYILERDEHGEWRAAADLEGQDDPARVEAFVAGKLGMTFVLEAHVTYDREVKEGDPLRITTQILDHDAKRIHYIHTMYHADEGYLAATNELMLMNIDYQTRRSAPWPGFAMERIEKLAAAHATLPRPAQAGRLIGIKKK